LNFNVFVRRAAELDVAAAQFWYETQRPGLGKEFHFEFSQIIGRLTENPLIYATAYRDVRRAAVHRFPYIIWYRVVNKDVIVLPCTSAKQDPGKSRARLSKPRD
jgi:toxin ParE1/3/4